MSIKSQVHGKSYADAVAAYEKMGKLPGVSEQAMKAYKEALDDHPGKPAMSQGPDDEEDDEDESIDEEEAIEDYDEEEEEDEDEDEEDEPGAELTDETEDEDEPEGAKDVEPSDEPAGDEDQSVEQDEIEALAAEYGNKEAVLVAIRDNELEITKAVKVLARFDPSPAHGRLYCKVATKGGISVYGLQRMPVTLFAEQWEKLAAFMTDKDGGVLAFIQANEGKTFQADEYVKGPDGKRVKSGKKVACQITRKAR